MCSGDERSGLETDQLMTAMDIYEVTECQVQRILNLYFLYMIEHLGLGFGKVYPNPRSQLVKATLGHQKGTFLSSVEYRLTGSEASGQISNDLKLQLNAARHAGLRVDFFCDQIPDACTYEEWFYSRIDYFTEGFLIALIEFGGFDPIVLKNASREYFEDFVGLKMT